MPKEIARRSTRSSGRSARGASSRGRGARHGSRPRQVQPATVASSGGSTESAAVQSMSLESLLDAVGERVRREMQQASRQATAAGASSTAPVPAAISTTSSAQTAPATARQSPTAAATTAIPQSPALGLGQLPPGSAITSVNLLAPVASTQAGVTWTSGIASPGVLPHAPLPPTVMSGQAAAPLVSAPSTATAGATPWQYPTPPTAGVCLSPGTEQFPQKLVAKVQSGAYVDMKEFLGDNLSLLRQLESLNITTTLSALPGVMKPRLREVTTLATWLYCFLAYAALRCPDQESRDRMAYARLIIREAQRHGGQGWLAYDKGFRLQAALDPSLRWNVLEPHIRASTLFAPTPQAPSAPGPAGSGGANCSICMGVDHLATSCAMAYLESPPPQVTSAANSQPPRPTRRRTTVASHSLCISWNRGRCLYPSSCSFRHVCSVCFQQHPAVDCPNRSSRPAAHDRIPGPTLPTSSRS